MIPFFVYTLLDFVVGSGPIFPLPLLPPLSFAVSSLTYRNSRKTSDFPLDTPYGRQRVSRTQSFREISPSPRKNFDAATRQAEKRVKREIGVRR